MREITLDGVTYVAKAKPATALGIPLADQLPDGWEPQGVIVLVRALDEDGQRRTTQLEGGDIMLWEAKGILETAISAYDTRLEDCDPDDDAAKDASLTACQVVKAASEQRYTLGLAYPSMRPDVAVARDGHRDFVSPEALEKCAWNYMARYREIGMFHKSGTEGHAEVVESYIYRGPDWELESPVSGQQVVIKAGDWCLGAVWDEHGWDMVQQRLVNGWSPEGGCARTVPSPERLAELR